MAAAQHQIQSRPYPVYHTPQSNSPASVASSQSHDHTRMYSQPAPAMQHNMYYQNPMGYAPSPYPSHPSQPIPQQHPQMISPHHSLANPPSQLAMPQASNTIRPQQGISHSPRHQPRMEPGMQRSLELGGLQRTPPASSAAPPNTMAAPLHDNSSSTNNSNMAHVNNQHNINSSTSNTSSKSNTQVPLSNNAPNPNAAPGPIPATTPLVVRQDNNGVQWIAFEYSRDRVKMEYTIRCDVESVDTDKLDDTFKEENCVYPRACGGKENYRGNRFGYEMECNTVGWSLAQLNTCLRGKRGLIQRAVDSWRNSNANAKLRSRRVRRMTKMNVRKAQSQSTDSPNHMASPREPGSTQSTPAPHPPAPRPPAPAPAHSIASPMTSQIPPQRQPPSNQPLGASNQLQYAHLGHPGGLPDQISKPSCDHHSPPAISSLRPRVLSSS